jgi:hypothetical protein
VRPPARAAPRQEVAAVAEIATTTTALTAKATRRKRLRMARPPLSFLVP